MQQVWVALCWSTNLITSAPYLYSTMELSLTICVVKLVLIAYFSNKMSSSQAVTTKKSISLITAAHSKLTIDDTELHENMLISRTIKVLNFPKLTLN
jgi:hypothetical protein